MHWIIMESEIFIIFAGVIKDSHEPITTWLWVAYLVMVIWAIGYLIQHISEFINFY